MFLFTGSIWINTLCVILTVFTAIYIYVKWIYQTWKRKNVPYSEPTFPFGSLQPLYKGVPMTEDVYNIVKKAKSEGLDYFGIYATVTPFFVPIDLDIIKCILTKDFNNFVDRGSYYNEKDDPISAHLFALGGNKWKILRKKLTPTFTSGKIKAMFSTLTSSCSILEEILEKHNRNEPIDIKEVLAGFTMDVIGSVAFGIESNNSQRHDTPFKIYSKKVTEKETLERIFNFFEEAFPNLARALHLKMIPTDVSKFFYDFVTGTVSYREKHNYTRNDFLQLLIDLKNTKGNKAGMNEDDLTMDEIVAQSFIFFVAGFETTATTMTFVLYELSRNPEIQERLRQELLRVLEKYDNNVSYDVLSELQYLQQVIDETLRKYPPVPVITRKSIRDYKIPNTNVFLEGGSHVMIPVKNIHYDENIYENPEKFDPERFTPEKKKQRHPYAHLPFGEGPRVCIGMRFALVEIKLTLMKILSRFRITLNTRTTTPLQIDPNSFILLAKGGIWLNLEKL